MIRRQRHVSLFGGGATSNNSNNSTISEASMFMKRLCMSMEHDLKRKNQRSVDLSQLPAFFRGQGGVSKGDWQHLSRTLLDAVSLKCMSLEALTLSIDQDDQNAFSFDFLSHPQSSLTHFQFLTAQESALQSCLLALIQKDQPVTSNHQRHHHNYFHHKRNRGIISKPSHLERLELSWNGAVSPSKETLQMLYLAIQSIPTITLNGLVPMIPDDPLLENILHRMQSEEDISDQDYCPDAISLSSISFSSLSTNGSSSSGHGSALYVGCSSPATVDTSFSSAASTLTTDSVSIHPFLGWKDLSLLHADLTTVDSIQWWFAAAPFLETLKIHQSTFSKVSLEALGNREPSASTTAAVHTPSKRRISSSFSTPSSRISELSSPSSMGSPDIGSISSHSSLWMQHPSSRLELLDLSHNDLDHEDCGHVSTWLDGMPHLTTLFLHDNPNIGNFGMQQLCHTVCHTIHTLDISHCQMSSVGLEDIVSTFPFLKALNISENPIQTQHIPDLLPSLDHLEELVMEQMVLGISNSFARDPNDGTPTSSTLKRLTLTGNRLNSTVLQNLACAYPSCESLTLIGCHLTTDLFKDLLRLNSHDTHLEALPWKELYLSHNEIKEDGLLSSLSQASSRLTSLQHLSLDHNPIDIHRLHGDSAANPEDRASSEMSPIYLPKSLHRLDLPNPDGDNPVITYQPMQSNPPQQQLQQREPTGRTRTSNSDRNGPNPKKTSEATSPTSVVNHLEHQLKLNRAGNSLLYSTAIPQSVWPWVLQEAQTVYGNDAIFEFLRRRPDLFFS